MKEVAVKALKFGTGVVVGVASARGIQDLAYRTVGFTGVKEHHEFIDEHGEKEEPVRHLYRKVTEMDKPLTFKEHLAITMLSVAGGVVCGDVAVKAAEGWIVIAKGVASIVTSN